MLDILDKAIIAIIINIIIIIIEDYEKFFIKIVKLLIIKENLRKKVFIKYYI